MLSVKTILHPTDFSPCSARAFELACSVARDYGAKLVVMHVITPTPEVTPTSGIVHSPTPGFRKQLAEELEKVKPAEGDVLVEHQIESGEADLTILDVAQKRGTDLIVMGTHGRTGMKRFVMGSVAETVLREAKCPVLTLRALEEEESA